MALKNLFLYVFMEKNWDVNEIQVFVVDYG